MLKSLLIGWTVSLTLWTVICFFIIPKLAQHATGTPRNTDSLQMDSQLPNIRAAYYMRENYRDASADTVPQLRQSAAAQKKGSEGHAAKKTGATNAAGAALHLGRRRIQD